MARIITKKGDVFCVELFNQYKYYFQYIADDVSQLNSSVIRVFKKEHSIDDSPHIEDIIRGEVAFYAHTILRTGIMANFWNRVGKHPYLGDTENVMFKIYADSWYVWKIGAPHIKTGKLTSDQESYSPGEVMSYHSLVKMIIKICGHEKTS